MGLSKIHLKNADIFKITFSFSFLDNDESVCLFKFLNTRTLVSGEKRIIFHHRRPAVATTKMMIRMQNKALAGPSVRTHQQLSNPPRPNDETKDRPTIFDSWMVLNERYNLPTNSLATVIVKPKM